MNKVDCVLEAIGIGVDSKTHARPKMADVVLLQVVIVTRNFRNIVFLWILKENSKFVFHLKSDLKKILAIFFFKLCVVQTKPLCRLAVAQGFLGCTFFYLLVLYQPNTH